MLEATIGLRVSGVGLQVNHPAIMENHMDKSMEQKWTMETGGI